MVVKDRKVPSLKSLRRLLSPVFKRSKAQRVIVFGSYARGDADTASDLDLVVIAETQLPFIDRFKDYLEIWNVSPVVPQMFVYTQREFDEMLARGSLLVTRAAEEGEVIYEAGPRERGQAVAKAS